MRKIITIILLIICTVNTRAGKLLCIVGSLSCTNNYSPLKIPKAPYQGTRKFCSDESRQIYTVTIRGNYVIIFYGDVYITRSFKKGLLFTNDPNEIKYRRSGNKKYNYGKYYVVTASYFSVLNTENGEYSFYSICK